MDIIFSREAANNLRERYTVLELETFEVEGQTLETFCVIPAESIFTEMQDLSSNIKLHEQLIQAIKDKDTKLCVDLSEVLKGRFGGELDSFYDIIRERFVLEQ
jgi:hypothetical protein